MHIEKVHQVEQSDLDDLNALIPQLSRSAVPLSLETLGELVAAGGVDLLTARFQGKIVGTLTLATFPIPTGMRAIIEDVVVDSEMRGRHVGADLVREALKIAREKGARTVDLTSRPERVAANAMYVRLGFESRSTNVYRFRLE